MTMIAAFRMSVEAFLQKTGMTPTAFGKSAVSDPNFVFDLRKGRVPNLDVVDRVQKFIAATDRQDNSSEMVNGEAA